MRRTDLARAAAALLAIGLPAPLLAQAMQCRAPAVLPEPRIVRIPRSEAPVRPGSIAGYSLALSWSPEYCRTRQRDPAAAMQCDGRIGSFGFILHGLWPEGAGGRGGAGDPRWCRAVPAVDTATLRATLCAMPSVDLVAHEWAKHGSCVTRTPAAYFAAARRLWNALRFPDMDRLSRTNDGAGPTAADLRAAFVAENDGLPADAIAIGINARGWLQDVRLCLDRRFRATPCAPGARGVRDAARLRIWRGGARAVRR